MCRLELGVYPRVAQNHPTFLPHYFYNFNALTNGLKWFNKALLYNFILSGNSRVKPFTINSIVLAAASLAWASGPNSNVDVDLVLGVWDNLVPKF